MQGEGDRAQSPQVIMVHQGNDHDAYRRCVTQQTSTNASYEDIRSYCLEWIEQHPVYKMHTDNCQLFVKHALMKFGFIEYETQTEKAIFVAKAITAMMISSVGLFTICASASYVNNDGTYFVIMTQAEVEHKYPASFADDMLTDAKLDDRLIEFAVPQSWSGPERNRPSDEQVNIDMHSNDYRDEAGEQHTIEALMEKGKSRAEIWTDLIEFIEQKERRDMIAQSGKWKESIITTAKKPSPSLARKWKAMIARRKKA